jgi:hypothetical protein
MRRASPVDRPELPSPSGVSNPSGNRATTSANRAVATARSMSARLAAGRPMRTLSLMDLRRSTVCWQIQEQRPRCGGDSPPGVTHRTVPAVGRRTPAISESKGGLADADGPAIGVQRPGWTVTSTPSRTGWVELGKRNVTSLRTTATVPAGGGAGDRSGPPREARGPDPSSSPISGSDSVSGSNAMIVGTADCARSRA